MTIINPNSISGIVSVTATSNALHFYESDGDKLNINADLTGNVTGTTATFSGDVTVGGVLTYEDVTSVDSVGLSTFQNGIHVTGGSVGIGSDNPTDVVDILTGGSDEVTSLKVKTQGRVELSRNHASDPYIKTLMNSGNPNIILGDSGGDKVLINGDGDTYFNGGDVGIGTDNPTESKIVISHTQTSTVKHLAIKDSTNNWVRKLGVDSSNNFGIFSGDTEHLRITGIGSVGISSATPKTDVDISQKTGAVALPQGTTAQRPTGSAPYIRKNTTNNALEYYDGTSWVEIITDYFPTGSVILG